MSIARYAPDRGPCLPYMAPTERTQYRVAAGSGAVPATRAAQIHGGHRKPAAGWPPVPARDGPQATAAPPSRTRHSRRGTLRGRGRKLPRAPARGSSDTAVWDAGSGGHRADTPRPRRVLCRGPGGIDGRAAACGRPGTSEKAAAHTADTPRTKGEPRAPRRPKEEQGLPSPAAGCVATKMPRQRRRRGRLGSVWGVVPSYSTSFDIGPHALARGVIGAGPGSISIGSGIRSDLTAGSLGSGGPMDRGAIYTRPSPSPG
jgi:hypothetical protein